MQFPGLAGQRRRDTEPHVAAGAAAGADEAGDAEAIAVDSDLGVLLESIGAVAAQAWQGEGVRLDLRGRLHLEGTRAISPWLEVS